MCIYCICVFHSCRALVAAMLCGYASYGIELGEDNVTRATSYMPHMESKVSTVHKNHGITTPRMDLVQGDIMKVQQVRLLPGMHKAVDPC